MEIIPAIDIRAGRCVRLYQGDYRQETVFSPDPLAVARHWQSQGACRLHLVDLDGAARGELVHLDLAGQIAREVKLPVQLGGGIRSLEALERVLGVGIARAILGTVAVDAPELVREACTRFGDGVVVSIDARDGLVATRGWLMGSRIAVGELAQRMAALGVRRLVYTDIARDGTLTEPNFRALSQLLATTAIPVIAAGGISSIDQLRRLAALGVEAAIVGRAIYTGDIDLAEAIAMLSQTHC